jgi:glycine/D-amino acid oxidase-like deaminating enzyme
VDGDLAALVPSAVAVRPRRLNMLATAPVARTVLPFPVYARHGHEYVHQTADGRIALGGFSDLDGDASWTSRPDVSAPVQARLDRWLLEELQVRAPVTHRWAGVVGFAGDPVPRCGPVPGTDGRVLALGGYNGTGHVQAWVASRVVADLVLDGRSASAGLYDAVDA